MAIPLITSTVANSIPKKTTNLIVLGGVSLVGFLLYKYFKLGSGVLENIGFLDSKEEQEVDNFSQTTDFKKAFDPNYHKNAPSSFKRVTDMELEHLTESVYDAFGFWNDNEEQVLGVFNSLETKADISRLTDTYFKKYGENLFYTLKDRLSDTEMANVINTVKNKA